MIPREILIAAKLFAKNNIVVLAQEVIEWQDTAILRDGRMRELAMMLQPIAAELSLRVAEDLVNRAALDAVVAT